MLLEKAQAGSRLDTLRELRDALSARLDECQSDRDFAALSLKLMEVLEQVEALEKAEPKPEGTALDEFTSRRVERNSAARKARAASGRQRGR